MSLVRRFRIMECFGDAYCVHFLILGDDAMFSLFFALCGQARSITVVDIDEDLLGLIGEASEELGLCGIRTVRGARSGARKTPLMELDWRSPERRNDLGRRFPCSSTCDASHKNACHCDLFLI
jgi:Branched-chain polyamine synthase A C-terminal domain